MAIELSAKDVPKVTWEYWGLVTFAMENPGIYGIDKLRTDCHNRLCKHYKLSKRVSCLVTDNLDILDNAVQLHEAFLREQKKL